jgi:phospholipase/carboxylesterase
VTELRYSERAADGPPAGLLVLHHGRGTDERDLLGLADALDPAGQVHVVTPRAPLELAGSPGYHWYVVPRVGYPDPRTFQAAYRALAQLHDALWESTGVPPERTVLGGFSMGAVMSYALGLGAQRPTPAGVLAFSGFIPTVEGWAPALAARERTRVFIAHGRNDPVIDVSFARAARAALQAGGLEVAYHESLAGHHIEPAHIALAAAWLSSTIESVASASP